MSYLKQEDELRESLNWFNHETEERQPVVRGYLFDL